MSQPVKPIVKKGAVRKDGTAIIFIQYCLSLEKRTLLDSGIANPPAFWNRRTCKISPTLPTQFGEVSALSKP